MPMWCAGNVHVVFIFDLRLLLLQAFHSMRMSVGPSANLESLALSTRLGGSMLGMPVNMQMCHLKRKFIPLRDQKKSEHTLQQSRIKRWQVLFPKQNKGWNFQSKASIPDLDRIIGTTVCRDVCLNGDRFLRCRGLGESNGFSYRKEVALRFVR